MGSEGLRVRRILSLFFLPIFAAPAFAGGVSISNVVFRIEASNANGTGFYEATFDQGVYIPDPGIFIWSGGPQQINDDSGRPIALLGQASTTIVEDPVIGMGFTVTAGLSDTTFTITSANVSFPAYNPALVSASGSLGVTDQNNNGATLTGQYGGGKAYLTQYNALIPGGTTFATLVDSFAAGAGGSNGNGENTGDIVINSAVFSMNSQIQFTLSAGDLANGTVNFTVKPEPATAALFAAAALLAIRRRR